MSIFKPFLFLFWLLSAAAALGANEAPAAPVTLDINNHTIGAACRGFGLLAEYGGQGGEIILTRRTVAGADRRPPDYFTGWGAICSARLYAPDGATAEYVEMGTQSAAEQTYKITIPAGQPGVWRLSVSGGLASDRFRVSLPFTDNWGVRGEVSLGVTASFPDTMHLFVPEDADRIVLLSWGAEVKTAAAPSQTDEKLWQGGVRKIFTDIPKGGTFAVDLSAFKKLPEWKKGSAPAVLFGGLPGLLCPTPAAALRLRGGLVKVGDGTPAARYVGGPLQARAWNHMRTFKTEDFALPPEFLKELNSEYHAKIFINQITDPASPLLGLSILPEKRVELEKNGFRHASYPESTGYLPLDLAVHAAFPGGSGYKHPGLVNRVVIAALYDIANMQGDNICRRGDFSAASRPDALTGFEPAYGFGGALAAVHRTLPPEALSIWRDGALAIFDKLAGGMSYQSNQWMHIIEGEYGIYEGTGEKRFKRLVEIQLRAFLDNVFNGKHGQHPAGYFLEEGGPDGNYDHMSGFPLASLYYTYGRLPDADPALVAKMKAGIEKALRFKSFYWQPTPDGKTLYTLPFIINRRVYGSFTGGYPAIDMAAKEFDLAFSRFNMCGEGLRNPRPPARHDVGGWRAQNEIYNKLPLTAKRVILPVEAEAGVWELPGQIAYKLQGGIYGVTFYSVGKPSRDSGAPLLVWTKKCGMALASVRNGNRNQYSKPTVADKIEDVTWSAVTGTVKGADGADKLFVTNFRNGPVTNTLEWREKDRRFVITEHLADNLGTVAWEYELSPAALTVTATVNAPGLQNPVLSLPLYFDRSGKAAIGIVRPGVCRLTVWNGAVDFTYPAGMAAELVKKGINCSYPVRLLRIPFPADGEKKLTFSIKEME